MKITVHTEYERISKDELVSFVDQIFDSTWAAKEFDPERLSEMKKDFLAGETIGAMSRGPNGQKAHTTWKLEE